MIELKYKDRPSQVAEIYYGLKSQLFIVHTLKELRKTLSADAYASVHKSIYSNFKEILEFAKEIIGIPAIDDAVKQCEPEIKELEKILKQLGDKDTERSKELGCAALGGGGP